MRILQVNTADTGGGAETVAWQLMRGYRRAGHQSWMAVGKKNSENPDTYLLRHDAYRTAWSRWCGALASRLFQREPSRENHRRLYQLLALGLGQPARAFHRWQGKEDFEFPGTAGLEGISSQLPDIIHCHNLHGAWLPDSGYFDLRVLPGLSRRVPLLLTLHDAWLLSGHCAHSFECDRWKIGCGNCPDLTIYPAVRRDATAYNWLRKRDIFAQSRLFVSTPSEWLMDKVKESILMPGVEESRVIPNGVDLRIFKPGDKREARERLALPQEAWVVLFAANSIRENRWKDFETLRSAVRHVAAQETRRPMRFVAVGEGGAADKAGLADVQFVPFERSPMTMARYYQAADVYVHAARVDTFPTSVLEAAACGIPVVATAVGGIPEQVLDGQTGFLVPAGDAQSMARQVRWLLEDDDRRRVISAQAARIAKVRFDLDRQVQAYLRWYEQLTMSSTGKSEIAHAC